MVLQRGAGDDRFDRPPVGSNLADPFGRGAKFVVQKMQLDYPVLRSDDLPGKYGVSGFPTMIIIDQQGNGADIHVGYSPHLFEEVTATVDRLLDAR
ncbi:MAG: TlpA family protein disulfide reductase [Isosphaerales bacterium]